MIELPLMQSGRGYKAYARPWREGQGTGNLSESPLRPAGGPGPQARRHGLGSGFKFDCRLLAWDAGVALRPGKPGCGNSLLPSQWFFMCTLFVKKSLPLITYVLKEAGV